MKTLARLSGILCCMAVSAPFSAPGRDLLPERRIENIPASDTSVQQCLIFRTVPGVLYRVESTHDLSTWMVEDEIYGVGHECPVAMREFTPPPPPPPGSGNPVVLPVIAPARLVGLRMRPSSGAAGGAVLSWRSLDDNSPMSMLLTQSLAPGWFSMPFFSERYGNYYFSIGYSGTTPIPPPEEVQVLGPKDAAMYAQFETSFPAMNQAVIDSTARARNTPPPAPPDPNSRKFWRIHCDWGLDTDMDGTPDWMEFEMEGAAADGLRGDAFLADTNHNGIPDGDELDYDQDGVADAKDQGAADASVTYSIGPVPRYALFPITNANSTSPLPDTHIAPLQISDKGTVLYQDGTWTGGTWTPLTLQSDSLTGGAARAINDNNVILGFAAATDPDKRLTHVCYWPDPNANTAPVEVVTGPIQGIVGPYYASTATDSPNGPSEDLVASLLAPGPVLSNDGSFHGAASLWEVNHYVFKGYLRWKLPAASNSNATVIKTTRGMRYDGGGNLTWGLRPKPGNEFEFEGGLIQSGATPYHCDFVPTNVTLLPNGRLLAMRGKPDKDSEVWHGGAWHPETGYAQAIDISSDGTAIGKNRGGMTAPILINGKWKDIQQSTPGLTEEWNKGTSLIDTTPKGWVLAKCGPDSGNAQYGVMVPIRLNGVDPDYTAPPVPAGQTAPEPPDFFAGGVDHLTARAEGGDGYVPELWIMAPIGGSTNVRWKAPLNATSKLKPECTKATFSPQEITATGADVHVSGNTLVDNENDSVTDFPATLKLGAARQVSTSIPVKVMRMKPRTVNVALHHVYSVDAAQQSALPFYLPTKADLEPYLNKVFGPQVNVTFVVSEPIIEGSATAGCNFDIDGDGRLETDVPGEVSAATPNVQIGAPGSNANIEVWVFGGGKTLKFGTGGIHGSDLYGWASGDRKKILIDGNQASLASIPNNGQMKHIHHTIAHEIGHVMINRVGESGHPSEGGYPYQLKWATSYDPYLQSRLLCPGQKAPTNADLLGTCLIKKEWDAIERWLKENIKDTDQ